MTSKCILKRVIKLKGEEGPGSAGEVSYYSSGTERPLYFMYDLTMLQESNFGFKWHISFLLY